MNSRRWSTATKIAVVALLAVLAIVLLVTFRAMIAPTIVAFLLTFILSYPVNWIQRRTGWARTTTVVILYLFLIALLLLIPVLLLPSGTYLVASLGDTLQELGKNLQGASSGASVSIGGYVLPIEDLVEQTGSILQGALSESNPVSIFRGVTLGVVSVVYVFVINFWLLKDQPKFRRYILDLIPSGYQEELRLLGAQLGDVWHSFLIGQLVLGLVVGTLVWIAMTVLGMPNAGGLALLAGLMEFLPTVGPAISGTVGTLVALFQGSSWLFSDSDAPHRAFAITVGIVYALVGQIESVYLIPRFVGGRVKLHPAVTFMGAINGAIVFGMLGVLLAAPVISSARVILTYIHRKVNDLEPFELPGLQQPTVRIRGLIAGRKIEGILFDLDGTLTEIDWTAIERIEVGTVWLDSLLPAARRRQLGQKLMISLESLLNLVNGQLWRIEWHEPLERWQPFLNRMRGHPLPAHLHLQAGVCEMLLSLRRNYRLALVSTRRSEDVLQFLGSAGLDRSLFDAVIVREDVRNLLPHSEALLYASQRMGLAPANLLVVSDSDANLRSASAAGMATAGTLSGLSSERELQSSDVVVHETAELVDWL